MVIGEWQCSRNPKELEHTNIPRLGEPHLLASHRHVLLYDLENDINLMNQLKRWSSLQRKGFGHDRASVAPGVWDSVVGLWDSMDRKMVVFQSLTTPDGIRLPSCQDNTKSVPHPSYAAEGWYSLVWHFLGTPHVFAQRDIPTKSQRFVFALPGLQLKWYIPINFNARRKRLKSCIVVEMLRLGKLKFG